MIRAGAGAGTAIRSGIRPRIGTSRAAPRRGTTYAFVLLTAASIAMLAVTAMLAQRLRIRAADREGDGRAAQILAMSGVEHALHTMNALRVADGTGSTWRETLRDMSFSGPLDGGTVSWSFHNHKGDPIPLGADKAFYAVGVGAHGTAVNALRVAVRPSGPAYSSLADSLRAKKDIELAAGTVIRSGTMIGANGSVSATSSSVFADVESGGEIAGGTYHGDRTVYAPLRGMPGRGVFDYYKANGTVISEASLPSSLDDRFIEDVVLSAVSNPFGVANAEGIYVIECRGKNIIIRNVRILGTLLITDPGQDSVIEEAVSWSTSTSSAPAILVDGGAGIAIGLSADDLLETARGVNYNPVGTPYEGDEDATLDDSYPSRIRGLVYVKGPLVFRPPYTRIEGVVLGDHDIRSEAAAVLELTHDPKIADDPPPGFFVPDGDVRIGAFSWERAP